MKNKPQHPSIYIRDYLNNKEWSIRKLATELKVQPSTLSRLLKKEITMSYEMALKLEQVVGKKAESWMNYQIKYDLYVLRELLQN